MIQIHLKAVEKAINMLNAIGAQYHIRLEDSEYGGPLEQKKKKKCRQYAGLTDYVRSVIDDIQVGECRDIDVTEKYPLKAIQACATTVMSHTYGNGSYMTTQNVNHVEVLRIS
jgi:hypothetical protein